MSNHTLTYSEGVKGFPSFYSFMPDWMIGMNNYFYTFKGGNLFSHNTNSIRNNFYGVQYNSKIQSVFNENPLDNKLFKTISIEGDDEWKVDMITDLQNSGFIEANWFEKKESTYYAFVRNSGDVPADLDEYALRSLNGIGQSNLVTGGTIVDFDLDMKISNIMSVGDMLYFALPPLFDTPLLAGEVLSVNSDVINGINNITIDNTITGATPISINNAFYLFIKNSLAESHGVLGHYSVFDIENDNIEAVNLFAIKSEVMKSYP
jgi:hypothetical protein